MPTAPFPTPCPPTPAARPDPFPPFAKVHALLSVGFLLLFGMPARVAAQVTNRWTGTGDGTTWNLASNWQLGRVPTATDIAVIDLNGTNTVVRITGISAAVRNLTSTATLLLDGGELAVSQGTNHLRGPLHASLSAIGATGDGTWLVATNTTTLTGTSLNAVGGAILRLTGARRFITGDQVNASIVARNPGSAVQLPNVAELEGATGRFRTLTVNAINGGWIQLGSVPVVEIGYTSFVADGIGSVIVLGALERMTGGELFARGGGLLVTPILQRLEGTSVTVEGVDSALDVGLIDALPGSSVRVAAGAELEFPGVTALAGGEPHSNLTVSGVGSELRFPFVTTLAGATGRFSRFEIRALTGGALRLPLLTSVTGGRTDFLAEGSGALLQIPALAALNFNTLEARSGAHLECPALTTVQNASVIVRGATTRLPVAQITNANGSSLQAFDGAVVRFTGLASYDALDIANVFLVASGNGSELAFPALPNLRGARARFAGLFVQAGQGALLRLPLLSAVTDGVVGFQAEGANSRLELPAITTLEGPSLEARSGGTIAVPALHTFRQGSLTVRGSDSVLPVSQITSLNGASVLATSGAILRFDGITAYDALNVGNRTLGATDAGSRLEFPFLTTLVGTASPFAGLTIEAGGGAFAGFPQLTQVSTPSIRFVAHGASSRIDLPILSNLVGTAFEARSGGRVSSPALTVLQFTSITAAGAGSQIDTARITEARGADILVQEGAQLNFPLLQRYNGGNGGNVSVQVSGTGSRLDLPVLTEFTGTTSPFTTATLRASNGGTLDLPQLRTLDTGALILAANGPQATLHLPLFVRGVGIAVDVSDSARLLTPQWSELHVGRLSLRGPATVDVTRLAVVDGSSLIAFDGAQLRLPALRSYRAGPVSASFEANGTGSLVELPAVLTVGGSTAPFTMFSLQALAGGTLRLPLVTVLDEGGFNAIAHGAGSRLDLPSLTATRNLSFSVLNGGTLSAPGLTSLTRGILELGSPGTWTTEQIRSLRNVSVVLNGAIANFPNLTDAGTSTFLFQNGGNAVLPPAADLQITAIGLPTTGRAGYPLSVTWTVTNASDVTLTGTRLDRFALRRSGAPDLDLGTVEVASDLAARAARAYQTTLILPGDLTGTWRLVVTADAGFDLFEGYQESNNTLVSAGEVGLSSPDLVVTEVTLPPGPLVAGAPFELTWVVHNTGTTNATAPWIDGILVGTNATDFTAGVILGTAARPSILAAGARYTNRAQLLLPLDPARPPGNYFLAVVANADHAQPEVTEANNVATRALQLTWPPLPDIVPVQVAGPATARPSTTVALSYAVTNAGPAAAVGPWTESIFLATPGTPENPRRLLGSFRVEAPLPAHSAQARSRSVTLPAELPAATNARWLVVVNPEPGPVESNFANNTATGPAAVTIPASLTLTLAQARIREDAGTFVARLQRNGSLDAPLTVQWSALPAGRIGGPATVQFAVGQSDVTLTLPILPDGLVLPAVPVALTARAAGFTDGTNTVTLDNTDPAQLTLQFAAAQVRQGQSIPATITRNAALDSPLVLQFNSSMPGRLLPPANLTLNPGQTSAAVAWIALEDGLWTPDQTITGSVGAPGFPVAAAEVTVVEELPPTLTLSLSRNPLKESDGPMAAIATVTRNGRLDAPLLVALTTTNTNAVVVPDFVTIPSGTNQSTFIVGTVARPSLSQDQVTELRAFPAYTLTRQAFGEPARASVTVLDTDRPTLTLELGHAVVAPNRTPATTGTVRRPTSAATALTVTLAPSVAGLLGLPPTVVIPANTNAVDFPIHTTAATAGDAIRTTRIIATAPGLVPAEAELAISGRPLPDLIAEAVTGPAQANTRANTSLSWRIRNQGLADHTGRLQQRVYLSKDGQLDPDDELVAEQSIEGQFAVGSFVGVARSIFLPSQPGNYWIFVQLLPEGALTEVSDQNNLTRSAAPIRVNASYAVAIFDMTQASERAGEPIEIFGLSVRPDGTPAAFEIVAFHVRRDGSERTQYTMTDENGDFSTTFTPGKNEVGVFEVFAGDPDATEFSSSGSFTRRNLVALPENRALAVVAGGQATLRMNLSNPGPDPISSLRAHVEGLPPGASARVTLPGAAAVGGTIPLELEVLAGTAILGTTTPTLVVATSSEITRFEFPLTLRITPPVPMVEITPRSIAAGALRGQPTQFSIAVTNTGALATGPLTLVVPELPWLNDTTPGARPSLAPGEGTIFDLAFTPAPDQSLGAYEGDVLVVGAGFQTRVPFSIRLVSTAVGDLEVLAEDEFTYYAADAPKLAGARVEVLDPYTSNPLASAITDAAGLARIPSLAEGTYRLRVSADRHFSREVPVTIQPGLTQRTRVLVPVEGVAYSWNVEPAEVTDRYRVTLESTFETTVPFPLVTALEPKVFPLVFPGEATTMNITFTNHGLIAARGLKLDFRSSSTYRITPFFTELGDLPARSSISVPVRVEFQPDLDARIVAGLIRNGRQVGPRDQPLLNVSTRRGEAGPAAGGGGGANDCDTPSINVRYFVVCGDDGLYHMVPIDVTPVGMLRDLIKCLQALAKGPSNVAGAACDCASQAAAGIGAALGGDGELPKPLKCALAVLCQDVGEIAKCICPGLEATELFYGTGGGIGGAGRFIPPPGGAGRCAIIPTGASPGASTHLATSLQSSSDGMPRALVVVARNTATATLPTAAAPSLASPSRNAAPAADGDGICAQVRLRLTQDVALTRAGFRAMLAIDNRLTNTPLTQLAFELHFFDAAGARVDDRFGIRPPSLVGLTDLIGSGTLAPGSGGTAEFIIVPSAAAAPDGPTPYSVGGELRYFDGTRSVTIPLAPTPLSVLPQPELSFDYYHQRDVFSDDPFTPETEPSQPFTLGLLVRNTGAGSARNVTVRSGQPRIVENEKGLLIDFQVVASEVFAPDATRLLTPSLTADLGDLEPGGVRVSRWLLKSTLQGLFLDYSATVEHLDPLGQPAFEAVPPGNVRIHELTRLVRDPRASADALPDFLVNEDPATDPDDLPDSIHLSNGSIEPVRVVAQATPDAVPTLQRREILLNLGSTASGWTYLRIPDPQGATGPRAFRLVAVLRPDGSALPAFNFWQTDRTFIGLGRRPILGNHLHLFDHGAPAHYRLVYEPVTPRDTVAPVATMDALPATSFPAFALRWSGTDNTTNALTFDVFASVDDGPFVPWRVATPLNGGQFIGELGHRYAFYAVAIDEAGNRSAVPAAPMASTVTTLENRPPTFDPVPTQTLFAGATLQVQLRASDPDSSFQTLTYVVDSTSPNGVAVDPSTGLLTWVVPRALGDTTQRISVSVHDDGQPALSARLAFDVRLIASNAPPVLAPLRNLTVLAGNLATFQATATDLDLPAQSLRFRLVGNVPAGATVDPVTGVFRWQTAEFAPASVNPITLEVFDDGSPSLADQQTFTLVVRKRPSDFRLEVGSLVLDAGQSRSVPLRLVTGQPLSLIVFYLPSPGSSLVDLSLQPLAAGLAGAQWQSERDGTYTATLFTVPGFVLDGDLDLARIAFSTRHNFSELARISPQEVGGLDPSGTVVRRGTANTGRIIVIGPEPVLDSIVPGEFLLYGRPGQSYRIETRESLSPDAPWIPGDRLTLEGQSLSVPLPPTLDQRYIRVRGE